MSDRTRLSQRTVRILIVAVIAAAGLAALLLNLPSDDEKGGGGAFAGQPQPGLYADTNLPPVDRLTRSGAQRALRAFPGYLRAHPVPDDRAFTQWTLTTVGRPPTGAAQQREIAQLHRIDANRTPAGIRAATWLETHGKKDVWKLYVKQYGQFVSKPEAKRAKQLFKRTYKLANVIVAQGKPRFARRSPYIVDPTLHALNQKRFSKKFSYPSKHAAIAAAMVDLLSHLEPHRAREYAWMADQIDYSRLYAGGHYPSDMSASAYLGTLAAEYTLAHQSGTGA